MQNHSITIPNDGVARLSLFIEPWGFEVVVPPGSRATIECCSELNSPFHIERTQQLTVDIDADHWRLEVDDEIVLDLIRPHETVQKSPVRMLIYRWFGCWV